MSVDVQKPNSKANATAREKLLQAGAEAFAEKGFGGASVREICKRAGTTSNMIHHYFGDKDGLLAAILDEYDQAVFVTPIRILQGDLQSRDDFIARFCLSFETTLEACIENRDFMLVALREQKPMRVLIDYQAKFVEFLEAAQKAGLVNERLNASLISGAVMDRITNYVHYAPWVKESYGVDQLNDADYRREWVDANVALFLEGFLA